MGERRGNLILRAVPHLHQKLAKKLAMAFVFLLGQRHFDLLGGHYLSRYQKLTKLHLIANCYPAHIWTFHSGEIGCLYAKLITASASST
jgi:hypothetical protein